jgi:hypothetical protein
MAAPFVLDTLDAILKDYYAGPVRDQLNNEMMIFDLFASKKMVWTGRKVIMPVRIGRNDSGGFRADGGTLPDADHNDYKDLIIHSKYLYGRMSLTGPAIEQAQASQGAFLNALESELKGATETVKNVADAQLFVGNGCVGFISDTTAGGGGALIVDVEFSGNLEAIPLNGAVPKNCKLVRLDTYAVLATTTCRQSANAGEILFGAAPDLNGAVPALPPNTAVAVIVEHTPAGVDTDITASGMYSNLAGGEYATPLNHFGVDRSDATNTGTALQSTIRAVAADGTRTSLVTPKTLQFMLDEIASLSGEMPDCMIGHYIFRQEYLGLLVQTVDAAGNNKANAYQKSVDNGDAGFRSGFTFNGMPLKVSRHCGKGLLIFLKTDSWVVAEVEKPGLAQLDGNVLSRVANKDAFEAYVRYYYNVVCHSPNRNGILVGLSYAGV